MAADVDIYQMRFVVREELPIRKIYGIGLHRTGLGSLQYALTMLGVECTIANTTRDVFQSHAAVGTPIPFLVDALDYLYDCRFIMTLRDVGEWVRSMHRVNHEITNGSYSYTALEKYYLYRMFTTISPSTHALNHGYVGWLEAMRVKFSHLPSRYLELNICDESISDEAKWITLANFIGVDEIPFGVPFPHERSSLSYWRT